MNTFLRAATLCSAGLAFSPANASTVIDSFNDTANQIVDVDAASPSNSNTVNTTSALGGFRTVSITSTGALGASAGVLSSAGIYTHSADALTSATSIITWDSNGGGLGGIDLLAADTPTFAGSLCYECFILEILSIDQGQVALTVGLEDSFGETASVTSLGASAGTHEISFSAFANTLDFTSIDSISLTVEGGNASDLTLDFQGYTGMDVSAVPVPAAAWLFITGLAGFLGFTRRNNA